MRASDVTVRSFSDPDEVRQMEKGRFELIRIGGLIMGRATYEPGWRWSEHAGPSLGLAQCSVEHVCLVLEGASAVAMDSGGVVEMRAGSLFYVPPAPHDSWVVGDQRYVSLHFIGAEQYIREAAGTESK
jgi:hypothetical protein